MLNVDQTWKCCSKLLVFTVLIMDCFCFWNYVQIHLCHLYSHIWETTYHHRITKKKWEFWFHKVVPSILYFLGIYFSGCEWSFMRGVLSSWLEDSIKNSGWSNTCGIGRERCHWVGWDWLWKNRSICYSSSSKSYGKPTKVICIGYDSDQVIDFIFICCSLTIIFRPLFSTTLHIISDTKKCCSSPPLNNVTIWWEPEDRRLLSVQN